LSALLVILIAVFVVGAAIGIYAVIAPRPRAMPSAVRATAASDDDDELGEVELLPSSQAWTREAGEEFAGLSEAARCELIFAVSALDDERSQRLLRFALDDPSAAVSLAAAHALARNGRLDDVRRYAENNPGPRAAELLQLVTLLA